MTTAVATLNPPKSPGFWSEAWVRFRRHRLSTLALAYVTLLAVVAITAPAIVGTKPIVCKFQGSIYFPALGYYNAGWENPVFRTAGVYPDYARELKNVDPDSWAVYPLVFQDPYHRIRKDERPGHPGNPWGVEGGPSLRNFFGTTNIGFDVFAQMVHGTQIAMSVGFVSMGIAAAIGIFVGALAGYFGGWTDMLLSRLIEVVMCIPTLVLILVLVAFLDNVTNWHLMAVIGCVRWTSIARLVRAEFIKLKEMEFVTAARAVGASPGRIMFRHMLRNALAPVLVPVSFGIASAILIEASLSFLGFGASPPNPSWGSLLQAGQNDIENMWWLIVFPGLAIFLTVLAFNLIGEGLQEATDPRLRQDSH